MSLGSVGVMDAQVPQSTAAPTPCWLAPLPGCGPEESGGPVVSLRSTTGPRLGCLWNLGRIASPARHDADDLEPVSVLEGPVREL